MEKKIKVYIFNHKYDYNVAGKHVCNFLFPVETFGQLNHH